MKIKSALNALSLKGMHPDEFAQELFECVVDGHNGIYTPQVFAQRMCNGTIEGVDEKDIESLLRGPHDEETAENYWEAWENIFSSYSCKQGDADYRIHLGESGDVFAYDQHKVELWESLNNAEFWDAYGS